MPVLIMTAEHHRGHMTWRRRVRFWKPYVKRYKPSLGSKSKQRHYEEKSAPEDAEKRSKSSDPFARPSRMNIARRNDVPI